MGKKSRKRRQSIRKRKHQQSSDYQKLEDRQLLATLHSFSGGDLNVSMDAVSDVAVVDTNVSGNVTVNGNDLFDNGAGGMMTVAAASVNNFSVVGLGTASGQQLTLSGDFSLSNLVGSDIETINLDGNYSAANASFTVQGIDVAAIGSLAVSGPASIHASGAISLANSTTNIDFAGSLDIFATDPAAIVSIADSNGLQLGNVDIAGSAELIASGSISQTSPLTVQGSTSLTATGNITLGHAANEFVGEVDVSTSGTATLSDSSNLLFDDVFAAHLSVNAAGQIDDSVTSTMSVTGSTTIVAGSNLVLNSQNGSLAAINLTTGNDAILSFGTGNINLVVANVSNNLQITTAGNISGGQTIVSGITNLNSGGSINLLHAGNDFVGTVNVLNNTGSLVSLRDANNLTLGAVNVVNMAVTTAGNLTQSGQVSVLGTTTIDANGNVTLSNAANDMAGAVNVSGQQITIRDKNDLLVGDIAAGGATQIIAGGDIAQVPATSFVSLGSTTLSTGGDAVLDSATNNFVGPVDISLPGAAVLADANNVSLGNIGADSLSVTAGGSISETILATLNIGDTTTLNSGSTVVLDSANSSLGDIHLSSGGNSNLTFGNGSIYLASANVGGDLNVVSDIDIAGGPVVVSGITTLQAGGDIDLGDAGNDFTGAVHASANTPLATQSIQISDASDLIVGNLTSTGSVELSGVNIDQLAATTILAAGNTTITSTGDVTLDQSTNDFAGTVAAAAAGTITLVDANDVVLDDVTATGLDVTALSGDITDTVAAVLTVSDSTVFDASGELTIDSATSSLAHLDIETGSDATLTFGTGNIEIDAGLVGGALAVTAAGDITAGPLNVTGNSDLDATGDVTATSVLVAGNSTVDAGGNIDIDISDVGGNLAMTAGGDITAGQTEVAGITVLDAGGNIDAGNAGNDFIGPVMAYADSGINQSIAIGDSNDLLLGDIVSSGSVDLSSGGSISQDFGAVLNSVGDTSADATIDLNLSNANDIGGTFSGSGAYVGVHDINDLTVGDIDSTNDLDLTATGSIDQVTDSTIVSATDTHVSSANGDVTLDSNNNDFQGVVTGNADSMTLADANNIELGDMNVGVDLAIDAGGSITDEAGADLNVAGTADLNAGTNIVLDGSDTDLSEVEIIAVGDVSLEYGTGDIHIASAIVGGNLIVDSPGDVTGGPVEVTGSTTLDAFDAIVLDDGTNDFMGVVSANAGLSIEIQDSNDLTIGNVNSAGGLELNAGSSIDQAAATGVVATGKTVITADGDVTFDNPTNDFGGSVDVSTTGAVEIADVNNVVIEKLTASDLGITATGSITDSVTAAINVGTSTTLQAGTFVTLDSAGSTLGDIDITTGDGATLNFGIGDINLTNADIGDNLSIDSDGDITGGPVVVAGETFLDAGGNINLSDPGNRMTGAVTADADGQSLAMSDAGDMLLGNVNSAGTLDLTSGGAIDQTAAASVVAAGEATIDAVTGITLDNVNNDFDGTLNADGLNILVNDVDGLTVGNMTSGSDISLSAHGVIDQEPGSTITNPGETTIVNTGDVTLDSRSNDFTGPVNVDTTGATTLADANDLELGYIESSSLTADAGGSITDESSAELNVPGATVLNAGTSATIDNADVFLGSIDVTTVGNATLQYGSGDINIASAAVGADFDVVSNAGILATGITTVAGATTLNALNSVTFGNSNNDFTGPVHAAGFVVFLADVNDLTAGNVAAFTDVILFAHGGTVQQDAGTSISAPGFSTFQADADILLGNSGNDFGGPVRAYGGSGEVEIVDINDLVFETVFANELYATATGSITDTPFASLNVFNTTVLDAGTHVVIDSASGSFGDIDLQTGTHATLAFGTGNISLTSADVGTDLVVVASGDINGGPVAVAGTTILDAGGDVTLDDISNQFGGPVSAFADSGSAQSIAINSLTDLQILDISSSGTVNLNSNGSVLQGPGSSFVATGDIEVVADFDVILAGSNNDFQGAVVASGLGVVIVDVNDLTLGDISATDFLDLIADGNIDQETGTSIDSQDVTFVRTSGNVTLDNAGNDFAGDVFVDTLGATTLADVNDLSLANINAASLVADAGGSIVDSFNADINISGLTILNAGADVVIDSADADLPTVDVTAAGDATLAYGSGDIVLTAADVDGDLNVNSLGNITGGPVSVAGETFLEADSNVALNHPGNDFIGPVSVNASDFVGQSVSINDANDLTTGDIAATGTLSLTSNGAINQAANTSIHADGAATFVAADDVTLESPTNDFVGPVNATAAGIVELADINDVVLGDITANDLDVTAAGSINDDAAATVNIANATILDAGTDINVDNASTSLGGVDVESGGDVTLAFGAGDIEVTNALVGQNLVIDSAGDISGGQVVVAGSTTLDSGGAIILDDAGNDFVGPVFAADSGIDQTVSIRDANGLLLGDVNSSGDLNLNAGADILQFPGASVVANGDATIAAVGHAIFDGSNNDFIGPVSATAQNVVLFDGNDLTAGNINGATHVAIIADGDIDQAPGTAIVSSGDSDIDAQGNVTLANAANDFIGPVDVLATGSIVIEDVNDIVFDNVAGTQLNVTAGGSITDDAGANMSVAGPVQLTAGTDVTLDSSTTSLGNIDVDSIGDTTLAFGSADINIVAADVGGDLAVAAQSAVNASSSTLNVAGETAFNGADVSLTGATLNTTDLSINATGNAALGSADLNIAGDAMIAAGMVTASLAEFTVAGSTDFDSPVVVVNNAQNDFIGPVSATGDLDIVDANDIELGDIPNAASLSVNADGSITQVAGTTINSPFATSLQASGDIILDSPTNEFGDGTSVTVGVIGLAVSQNLSIADATDFDLGTLNVPGDLTVMAGGNITGDAVVVAGATSLDAAGEITLANTANDFVGPVSLNAGGTGLGNSVTINDSNDLELGEFMASGNVNLTAGSDISQQINTTYEVAGQSTLNAGKDISLANAGNDFGGIVDLTLTGINDLVSLTDLNDLSLADANIRGETNIVTGGDLTAGKLVISGPATISAGGDVILTDSGNDFEIELGLTADNANIVDANGIILADVNVSGDLAVTAGGAIAGADPIVVGGDTLLDAVADVTLTSPTNDFGGTVSVTGTGAALVDANDLNFDGVDVSGNLTATAAGDITNTENAVIQVGNNAVLDANQILIGNQAGDSVNILRVRLTATGLAEIHQENNVRLQTTNVGELRVQSTGRISNSPTSQIDVAGNATFAGTAIIIGTTVNDSFNADQINFTAATTVAINENSDSVMFGDNTAFNFAIVSDGSVSNAVNSTINVGNLVELEGSSITIGQSVADEFNAFIVQFTSTGDVTIAEDSRLQVFGDNTAANLLLASTDVIVDATVATTVVTGLASFDANFVLIGDKPTDTFNAGSINFNVNGNVRITENSSTLIVGSNVANAIVITSTGELTNDANTSINTTARSQFVGESVDLGTRAGDVMNFASLTVNATMQATIHEDSGIHLFGDNTAADMELKAEGTLIDGSTATISVTNLASFEANSMRLGDLATDSVTTGQMTLNTVGNAYVVADNDIYLAGNSSAKNMTLRSTGFIGDLANATTNITGSLAVDGGTIDLGSDLDINLNPQLNFAKLNVNATGSASVESGQSFFLYGNNTIGDELTLVSTGNITDTATASTLVENTASFEAVDVVIGDMTTDCFDIVSGIEGLFVNASGINDVQLGC